MAETNALPTGAPQAAPIENSSPLDQAPAHNPILDIGGYNPMPDSVGISTQIKGSPITGINPGLKDPLGTKDFAKSIGNYISNVSISQQDPHEQMKPFSYNGDFDGANFERYFGTKQFNKLGFNPYRDNDALYNDNRTFGDDFTRAASQWPSLFKSGFMSGIRSWGDMFSDPLAPDIKTAREMQKAMAIGSSTKGGVGAFINNTFLNSAYTVGIGAELLIEELALAGITAVTGGSAGAFSLPAMLARGTKAGRLATESVKAGEEVLGAMKNLNKMSDLRTFWNTTGKAAGKIGGALNPLENTWEIGKELAYGTNALKFTKAGGKIDEFARVSSNFGRFAKDMILVKSAVSEAKLEGGMVQMDVTKDLMEKYRAEHDGLEPEGEEMVKIQNIAKEEAKRTALWNLPAIMWSNKLMYETIFAPFERGAQNVTKDIIMGTTKEGKKVFKQLGDGLLERAAHTGKSLLQPKAYGKFAMGYMKANLAEGVQENLQEAISMGAKEHAKAVYTNENRGVYEGYMGHFLTGLKGQFSAEGAETFAGGLLMGAMAQPMMSAPMAIGTKVWDSTLGKKNYQEYRTKRDAQVQATVATLNELYDDPMKFFAPDLANLVTQDELAVDMHHAVIDGAKKKVKDIEQIAMFEHIHTALLTGHYDTIMDQIKAMKEMTPEDAAELLPEGTDPKQGTKVLESIDTILKRAEEIKSNFDEVNANYPNPFDPNRFTKGTIDYNSQALAYEAWNKAQKHLLFAKESFNNHSRRLEEMATALSSTSRPLEKTSAQDFMVLLDPELTNQNIKTLAMDIRNLDPSDREQSKLITEKTKQIEHLASIKEAFEIENEIEAHYTFNSRPDLTKVGNTKIPVGSYVKVVSEEEPHFVTEVITNAKGKTIGYKVMNLSNSEQTTISTKKASYLQSKKAKTLHADLADTRSRKAFSAYLKHLSKKNGDFFFTDKIDKAYGIIKDHMLLKDEQQYLVNSINILNNPKGFLRLAQDLERMNKQIFDARKEILDKNAREFLVRVESNNGVNTLMKKTGLVPTEDYWDYFVETIRKGNEPLLPTEFLDSKRLEEVKEGEKFDQGLETWKDVLEMIKKEEVKEPEGIKPVTEAQGKTETKPEVKPEVKEKVVSDMETVMQQYNTGKLPNETISAIDDILDNDDTYSSLDEPTEAQKLQAFEDNKVQILSLVKPKETGIPFSITLTVRQQLADLGYNKEDVYKMRPEEAKAIIDAQTTKPKAAPVASDIEAKKADIEKRRQEELLVPISLIKLPQYLAETIKKAVERLSVTQRYDIVKAAINGKTAQQIVSELNLIDENGRRDTEIVRQVRAYYGIPSLDAEDYKDWKISIDKINAKYDAELKALEAPKAIAPVKPNIEAKKADIERRRQEELNQQTDAGYSIIALDYLFTGGRDVIQSTDYLLQALVGGFTNAATEINNIRNKYADKLGNIKDDINSDVYNQMMNEIRDVINKNYNDSKANEIFDKILKNATGFTSREGNQISSELDKLNEQNESKINAKYDAELKAVDQSLKETTKVETVKQEIKKENEAKKADIERRRQEELEEYEGRNPAIFFKHNTEGSNTEATEKQVQDIEELIQAAIDNGNVSPEKLWKMILGQGYTYSSYGSATATLAYLKNRLNGKTNAKVGSRLTDVTNAKYDAELAALEKPVSETFTKTSTTTETSSTPQKKAEAAIKKLKEDTKGVKPTEEGYRIKGDLYELRVSTAAGRVVGKEFAFSTTDKGKKVLGIYDRMKRDKDFSPKDFVAKLKKDPTTSSLFEEVKSRTTGKITVRFSEDKANSIVEALTAEDSRANLIKTLDAVAYKDATDRGNTVDGIARDFFDKGSAEKPDNITQEAFDDLIKQLTALRTEIEANGDIILTNGLIVYGEDESVKDRGIAGEMDLLVITPDGKYKIYDIKTNDSWKGYVGDKRDGHAAQLSLYQNLLEHITGIPVVERRIIPIKTTTDPNGVVTDIEDPFSKTNLEPNDLILPYDSRVEEYVSKPEIKAEVLVKGKPVTTEDKIAKIRRDIETAPDLIALDKAYDNNAKIVQELLEEEDKILEEEELEFETESVLFKINELMAEKRQELVKDAKNVNNLRWAAQNGATVNFDTLTEVGTDYIPQVPKKDTIKVTKLGLDYTIPVTSITSINLPGELAPQVIITEEDEKVISETDKAVKELADDPVAAAKKIAEKLKLSDDELDNEAKCNNH